MRSRVNAQGTHWRRGPAYVDHSRYHRVLSCRSVNPVLVHAERAADVRLPFFVKARMLQDDVGTDDLLCDVQKPLMQQPLRQPEG